MGWDRLGSLVQQSWDAESTRRQEEEGGKEKLERRHERMEGHALIERPLR